MTAEVIIMNKDAIAIAADSAASIGNKIYTTNKVFMLSKYCPVSIMIYGNGAIMGVPWEPIIKLFRDTIIADKPYNRLEGYAYKFIDFLNNNTYLFPESQQRKWFEKLLIFQFNSIRRDYENRINIDSGNDHDIDICITKSLKKLIYEVNSFWKKGSLADIKQITGPYYDIVENIRDEIFKDINLDRECKRKLERIAALSFYNNVTGIVITGFGTEDLFPISVNYGIAGSIENFLVYTKLREDRITFDKPAKIIPFAQTDVINTYLNGIDPEFDNYLQNAVIPTIINTQIDGVITYILNDLKELTGDDDLIKILERNYGELKKQTIPIINSWKSRVMLEKVEDNRSPIIRAVEFLPKEEIAIMAESLLTLTSLKRKYSIFALENVGGEIDVAVISKSDGFVWIKRKHYFDKDLNHHFFSNYYNPHKKSNI